MSNPGIGPATYASWIPHLRHGWWRQAARLGLAVLVCTFAGAGQAQERYDNLDHAVNTMIEEIVKDGNLRGQSVSVEADDFFEEETGFDLRPRLSKMLREKCRTALTGEGVNLEMVESEEAWVLHGRWWREARESGVYLHLRLFIARPVEGDTPPQEHEGEAGLVPIEGVIGNAVKPKLRDWGDSVVRQLERDLPGSGRYRLHIRPFMVHGAAQPESLGQRLHNRWRQAFTGSRRFTLVSASRFDGELFGAASVTDEHVEVDLYVQDTQGQQVAAAFVAPGRGLFDSSFFRDNDDVQDDDEVTPDDTNAGGSSDSGGVVSGVDAELVQCAGHVEAGRVSEALKCYAGMLKEAPGNGKALEGVEGLKGETFRDCDGCPELVVVPSGSFMMGSPSSEEGRLDNEGPEHEVTIGYPFAVGVYEVTFGEWDACESGGGCGGYRPGDSGWGRGPRPVINVDWKDAKAYVEWLSGETGEEYRLLSESEWEYVARAGTRTRYWWGDEIGRNRANCDSCGSRWDGQKTALVSSFSANEFGLHDVHGNVWEWVEDCYTDGYGGAPKDGSAWEWNCDWRVVRGGSWLLIPGDLRSADRFGLTAGDRSHNVGFRVARTLTP